MNIQCNMIVSVATVLILTVYARKIIIKPLYLLFTLPSNAILIVVFVPLVLQCHLERFGRQTMVLQATS